MFSDQCRGRLPEESKIAHVAGGCMAAIVVTRRWSSSAPAGRCELGDSVTTGSPPLAGHPWLRSWAPPGPAPLGNRTSAGMHRGPVFAFDTAAADFILARLQVGTCRRPLTRPTVSEGRRQGLL